MNSYRQYKQQLQENPQYTQNNNKQAYENIMNNFPLPKNRNSILPKQNALSQYNFTQDLSDNEDQDQEYFYQQSQKGQKPLDIYKTYQTASHDSRENHQNSVQPKHKFQSQKSENQKTSIERQQHKGFQVRINGRIYTHFKPDQFKLDSKFLNIVENIDSHFRSTFYSKPEKVRIEQWLKKLCDNCCEKIPLMKNRNKYAKLLKVCVLDIKRLEGIFKKMPPSDGEDLRMIQNHEILEIESFANRKVNKKRQKSQKKAKEIYQYNSQKAREQIESHRQQSVRAQSEKREEKPSSKVIGTIVRGANGEMKLIESSKNGSNPRNYKFKEYKLASKILTPNNKINSGKIYAFHTASSIKQRLNSKDYTMFDSTISPINQKSNNQTAQTSNNHTAIKAINQIQKQTSQDTKAHAFKLSTLQNQLETQQPVFISKKHNFNNNDLKHHLEKHNSQPMSSQRSQSFVNLNEASTPYLQLAQFESNETNSNYNRGQYVQSVNPTQNQKGNGCSTSKSGKYGQRDNHFQSVQVVETYRTQNDCKSTNGPKSTRRSRAERNAIKSQSANSRSPASQSDSNNSDSQIRNQHHKKFQQIANSSMNKNEQNPKKTFAFQERDINIFDQKQNENQNLKETPKNNFNSQNVENDYLSPNFNQKQQNTNSTLFKKSVPRIDIEKLNDYKPHQVYPQNICQSTKSSNTQYSLSQMSNSQISEQLQNIIQSAEVLQNMRELQEVRQNTQRLLEMRQSILNRKIR